MTFQGDPYRILGVLPGASLNEIRAAYRRLAKAYHPDAAGERALARFLAIQAAYERLVDGEGRLRSPGAGRGAAPTGRSREPWRADPARAKASRDAWRARRAGAAGTGASSSRSTDGPTSASTGGSTSGSSGGSTARARPGPDPTSRRRPRDGERVGRHGPRRATPGSTTYDEASDGTRDPRWDGGSWYGPSLGTYWTINPREYADPRKHGPEYQARARRAGDRARGTGTRAWAASYDSEAPGGDLGAPGEAAPSPSGSREAPGSGNREAPGPRPSAPGAEFAPRSRAGQRTAPRPGNDERPDADEADRDEAGGSWTYAADHDGAWTADRPSGDAGGSTEPSHATWTSPSNATAADASADRVVGTASGESLIPDLESLVRQLAPLHLLALGRRGWRWRVMMAVVGWAPIGLALGSLLTSITGCAAFSASCPESVPTIALLVQPLIPLVLALTAPVAALAAFGAIAALSASVPLAAVLAVGSGPNGHAGAPVLTVLVATVYLVALVGGAITLWRPAREP